MNVLLAAVHVASSCVLSGGAVETAKETECMQLAQECVLPDSTHVFPGNQGEGAVDGLPVHAWVVGVSEECHVVRCSLATRLPDCNSAFV